MIRRRRIVPLLLALLASAAPAAAAPGVRLNVPAGRLGDAAAALGRQAGISISIPDARLWRGDARAIRGTMTVEEALRLLLRGTGARAVRLGGGNWRVARPDATATPQPSLRQSVTAPIAPPEAIEEAPIVVTGSKRDLRLQDYPGTVTLLDGADLMLTGAGGTEAVLSRLATVSSTHLGAGRNKLFIRGIADSSFTGPTQATVGQYLGDVRLTYNAPDPDLRLYDIATVEVLEGPQGTLYGAGSLGGIIRIVRNPPRLGAAEASLSAGASLTAHGDPGADIGGMVNLPIAGDRLALRAVGYGVREGGYIDNPQTERDDINRTDIVGGRLALRLDAGDGWTIDLGGALQNTDGADSQYADRDAPPLTRSSRIDQGFEARYRLGELVIGKQWDTLRFLSSTGIVSQDLSERYDATAGDGPLRVFRQDNDTALFSSENRLWRPMRQGYGWVLGASFIRNRTRLSRALGETEAPLPVTGVTNRITEITVYGEASVAVVPGLTATAGGRFTRARLSGEGEDVLRAIALARAAIVADRTEKAWLPSLGLSATMLPGLTLFARYQEGFRPGGLAIDDAFVRRFRNDHVSTFETGIRYGVPGQDGLYASASAFYTRWRDIQADFVDSTGLPTTDNIGDGRIYSLAATAGFRPVPRLGLDLAFAYNNSRVTEPTLAFLLAPERMSRIPNVAKITARLGGDYDAPLTDMLDLRVSGWIRYVGKSRLGIGPILGDAQGDYLDTALTARIGRPGLGVSLSLTNLTDSIGNRFALGTPFSVGQPAQITPLRPRTLRLAIDVGF